MDRENKRTLQNCMDSLFATNNHIVLTRIFLHLDGQSLKNARLACRLWNNFIMTNIWGVESSRDVLKQRLDGNWFELQPREKTIRCSKCVFDIAVDEKEFCFSLESGGIEVLKL